MSIHVPLRAHIADMYNVHRQDAAWQCIDPRVRLAFGTVPKLGKHCDWCMARKIRPRLRGASGPHILPGPGKNVGYGLGGLHRMPARSHNRLSLSR
jgi:hypothetical protein